MVKLSVFCVFVFSAFIIDVNPNPLVDLKEQLLGPLNKSGYHFRPAVPIKNNELSVVNNPILPIEKLPGVLPDVLPPTPGELPNHETPNLVETIALLIEDFIADVCVGLLICLGTEGGDNSVLDKFLK